MENNQNSKIRKLLLILLAATLFSFLFADIGYAKNKEEFLGRFKEIAKERQQSKKIEIECEKNPAICPIILNSLAIDENGNIEGVNLTPDVSSSTSGVGIFVEKLKQTLTSLGLTIENGIAKVKELVAEKITATKRIIAPIGQFEIGQFERIEMQDKITGEIYCTWIENGEWVKVKGECGGSTPTTSSTNVQSSTLNNATTTTTTTTESTATDATSTPETTCTPNWQCDDWSPLPESRTCGETFTQTRTCNDGCGNEKTETQEATGTLLETATSTCPSTEQ